MPVTEWSDHKKIVKTWRALVNYNRRKWLVQKHYSRAWNILNTDPFKPICDDKQGCTLAAPGGLWSLTFGLGLLENLTYVGRPGFHNFSRLLAVRLFS